MRFAAAVLILAANTAFADDAAPTVRMGGADDPHRPDSVRAAAVSPDGRFVALAGEPESPSKDQAVQLREAATGRLVRSLAGHEGPVRSVAFSPRGDRLATVTGDDDGIGVVRVFETATGRLDRTIDAGGRIVAFLPDGRLLVAGPGRVLSFDAQTGREVGRAVAMPVVKAVSADGRLAVGASQHGRAVLEVRDLRSGSVTARLDGAAGDVIAAAFDPSGRAVVGADPRGKALVVWEVLTGAPIRRLSLDALPMAVAFTADGRHVVAGGFDGSVRFWEVATGTPTGRIAAHAGPVTVVLPTPDGRSLLTGSADRSAALWPLAGRTGSALPDAPPAEPELAAAWETLAAADPAAAWTSLGLLAARPEVVLPDWAGRVRAQVAPIAGPDLARRLAELDDPDYRVREAATRELARAGESIRPQLERAAAETRSAEVAARLRLLLRSAGSTPRLSPGDVLRLRRLIGATESLEGPDVDSLLRLLADESPDPVVAREAREVLSDRAK